MVDTGSNRIVDIQGGLTDYQTKMEPNNQS
jgi:hypothetical protein